MQGDFSPTWSRWVPRTVLTHLAPTPLTPAAQQLYGQLNNQLRHTVITIVLLLNVPFSLIIGVFLGYDVWVTGGLPPIIAVVYLLNFLGTVVVAWVLWWRGQVEAALLVYVSVYVGAILAHAYITHVMDIVFPLLLVLSLPLTLISVRAIALLGLMATVGAVVVTGAQHGMTTSAVVLPLVAVPAACVLFMIIGDRARHVLRMLALTMTAREADAAARARLEERAVLLESHHNRLLAAQHDLRAPVSTALRATQILQDPVLDVATAQPLLRRLEPLLLRLRTRIDALVDDAKSPRLAEQVQLPVIDLDAVVATHLPELQRWVQISTTGSDRIMPPQVTYTGAAACRIRGRAGEMQRIVENLVLNSTAAGAQQIAVTVRPTADDQVELCVRDDGGGFPPALLAQPFQAISTQRSQGIGLGLVGVAANVAAFRGTIALANVPGGAQVCIQFPCVKAGGDGVNSRK